MGDIDEDANSRGASVSQQERCCQVSPSARRARGGSMTLDISAARRSLSLRWFDPHEAGFAEAEQIPDTPLLHLVTPDTDQSWLALLT